MKKSRLNLFMQMPQWKMFFRWESFLEDEGQRRIKPGQSLKSPEASKQNELFCRLNNWGWHSSLPIFLHL